MMFDVENMLVRCEVQNEFTWNSRRKFVTNMLNFMTVCSLSEKVNCKPPARASLFQPFLHQFSALFLQSSWVIRWSHAREHIDYTTCVMDPGYDQ